MKAPAGWYLDPDRDDLSRYWNGTGWTNHRQTPEHDTGPIEAFVETVDPHEAEGAHDPTASRDLADRVPGHTLLAKLADLDAHGALVDDSLSRPTFSPQALPAYHQWLGERTVAAELRRLDDSWTVLHSVPIGRGSSCLDHVVIGPAGVIVISTKRHPGGSAWINDRTMMIDGSRVAYLTNSAHQARQTMTLLTNQVGFTATAHGVLALVELEHLTERRAPGFADVEVTVLDARRLVRLITSMPRRYDEKDVAALADAARRPQTWRASPRTEFGVDEVQQRLLSPGRRRRILEPHQFARRRRRIALASVAAGALVVGGLAAANASLIGSWVADAVAAITG